MYHVYNYKFQYFKDGLLQNESGSVYTETVEDAIDMLHDKYGYFDEAYLEISENEYFNKEH